MCNPGEIREESNCITEDKSNYRRVITHLGAKTLETVGGLLEIPSHRATHTTQQCRWRTSLRKHPQTQVPEIF